MSLITTEEASLINDAVFLDELEQFARADEHVPRADADAASLTYADAFAALETGLPMDSAAPPIGVPHHERAPHEDRAPLGESYEPPSERPAPADRRVPFIAAALVLLGCLTFGAAAAALVFHDRLTHVTAPRPASR